MKKNQKKIAVLKNGIGYLGPLIGIPFTLKFIEPASYGVYVIFVAVVTLISPLLTIRAEMAAPAAKDANVRDELFKLSSAALIFTSALLVLTTSIGVLGGYLTISIGVALFAATYFQGWSNIQQAIAIYQGTPSVIIDARLAQGIIYGFVQPICVFLYASIEALLFSDILARAFFAFVIFNSNRKVHSFTPPRLKIERINWGIIRVKDIIYSTFSVLCNGLSTQFIVIFSGLFFGAQTSAAVGLAYKILSAPVRVISQAIQPYFLTEFSASYRSGGAVRSILYKYLKLGFWISLPIYGTVIFISKLLVENYLTEWVFALDFLYVIWPVFLISFFVIPISQALVVTQNSRTQLLWEFLRIVILFVVSLVSIKIVETSALQAISGLVIAMSLSYIWLVFSVIRIFRV